MPPSSEPPIAARLRSIIPERQLNSWENDEILACLTELDPDQQELVLQQIAVIWPVSHALCLAFLEAVPPALACLDPRQFSAWVRGILDRYEAQGLQEARRFMADLDNHFVCTLQGRSGLVLSSIKGRLGLYLRGVAGRPFDLEHAAQPGTDSVSIFLPRNITLFRNDADNFLVYKFLASLQWAFLRVNLYCHAVDDEEQLYAKMGRAAPDHQPPDIFLNRFFHSFTEPEQARAVYHFLQTFRALDFLQKRLPGLMADSTAYFQRLTRDNDESGQCDYLLGAEYQTMLRQLSRNQPLVLPTGLLAEQSSPGQWHHPHQVFLDTARICTALDLEEQQHLAPPPFFQGSFLIDAAHARRLARRQDVEQQFIKALSLRILPSLTRKKEEPAAMESTAMAAGQQPDNGANLTLRLPADKDEHPGMEAHHDPVVRHVQLDDEQIDLDNRLQELGREIIDDLGHLPQLYLDSAAKMAAGRSYAPDIITETRPGQALSGTSLYDEWDYRRQGFRHNWCHLLEKEVHPSGGTFISRALNDHRGVIKQLKRHFEQMRSHHRFVGRQRDGDDIDLDALTEALADHQAGLPPSERLFVRQLRDQRDIAALFMVDLSSSTEGWVGQTIKESLLVMAEAMESLGDRYAIYGFSGMRRTRSEVFRIKKIEEPYSEKVQGRIAALTPQDYTRMGPPIRHFTRMLAGVDARVRLLIILTDGKPEDYDDYKGQYAIEDTRHALIEAKHAGIHPFCITIDHQAQDYISHLFGEVNYLFIDDVKMLPRRLPDMYRILTS